MFDLNGKVALVTGSSSGIGRATAKLLHSLGAKIILSGTNLENLEKLSKELGSENSILSCNLKNTEEVKTLIEKSIEIYGKLDILVCNAGITKDNLSFRMSLEDWNEVIQVNLTSSFILCKDAAKHMIKNKYGRIVTISSIVASTGNMGQANYTAAKAGLVAMTKSLAKEISTRGITANIVSPGFIETPMTDVLPEKQKEKFLESIPLGKLGTPEDIANLTAFLVSDKASYITGQNIHVNGGMLMP